MLRKTSDLSFVNRVFDLKLKGKHWDAIDLIVKHWEKTRPEHYKSFIIDMEEKRGTRANSHGSNKKKTMRSLVDIPEDIVYRIRRVYDSEELIMDMDFFKGMHKRYSWMRVTEKI